MPVFLKPNLINCIKTFAWTLFFFAVIDVSINLIVAQLSPQSSIYRYFHYGDSVESKIKNLIDANQKIIYAGWLNPPEINFFPEKSTVEYPILISNYGMSFSFDILEALVKENEKYQIRKIGGPAAPLNHSYDAYLKDRGQNEAKIVTIGILASSIYAINTLTGATWNFDVPYPYTYSRYYLNADNELSAKRPLINSLDELKKSYKDPKTWSEYTTQLHQDDEHYSYFLFNYFFDHSVLLRLIRRGWAQHVHENCLAEIYTKSGFKPRLPYYSGHACHLRRFCRQST